MPIVDYASGPVMAAGYEVEVLLNGRRSGGADPSLLAANTAESPYSRKAYPRHIRSSSPYIPEVRICQAGCMPTLIVDQIALGPLRAAIRLH